MRFDYITDESEKSLAPFFSSPMISATFTSALVIGGLCVLFWPWQNLISFISKNREPLVFFEIFTATLIINSYVNLRCGRGEIYKSNYPSGYRKEIPTFEKERDFFQYGMIGFLLHTLFLVLPFLPMLILSASISGVSLDVFAKAVSSVFAASFLCRMFGFVIYLFWGRLNSLGFWVVRAFIIVFIFATAVFAPFMNPIRILYELNRNMESINGVFSNAYYFYMVTVMGANVLLVIWSHILVKRHILKENTT